MPKAMLWLEYPNEHLEYLFTLSTGKVRKYGSRLMAFYAKDLHGTPVERPWVAKVNLNERGKIERCFLRGIKDYSEADEMGANGVKVRFVLEEGCAYESRHWTNAGEVRRFIRVLDGKIVEIERGEI